MNKSDFIGYLTWFNITFKEPNRPDLKNFFPSDNGFTFKFDE